MSSHWGSFTDLILLALTMRRRVSITSPHPIRDLICHIYWTLRRR